MLVLSLLLTISAVYAGGGGGGSKTYLAKATVAVAEEQTGVGSVYVKNNQGTRFPDSGDAPTASTNEMSQDNNKSFSITIGAYAIDPDYCLKEWTKDGTTVITATGQEMV